MSSWFLTANEVGSLLFGNCGVFFKINLSF